MLQVGATGIEEKEEEEEEEDGLDTWSLGRDSKKVLYFVNQKQEYYAKCDARYIYAVCIIPEHGIFE
jgi:hypothetical protein